MVSELGVWIGGPRERERVVMPCGADVLVGAGVLPLSPGDLPDI